MKREKKPFSLVISYYFENLKKSKRNYNIACVLAVCKSYWAAMNKIFIYARACVNKDFVHDDVLKNRRQW